MGGIRKRWNRTCGQARTAPVDVRADGVECPFPVWTEYVFKGVYHILAELAREETGHLRVERNEGERRVRK